MATITTAPVITGGAPLFEQAVSIAIAVADTVELTGPVQKFLTHHFVSVQFFDVSGDPETPGAGTLAIEVQTVNSEDWETVSGSPIDATDPVTLNFAANIRRIRAVPTGLTVAITYKLTLTSNGR